MDSPTTYPSFAGKIDLSSQLNGDSNTEWENIRRDALATFDEIGFPTKKVEDWKYLNFVPYLREEFQTAQDVAVDSVAPWKIEGLDSNLLVFVNGKFNEALSDIKDDANGLVLGNFKSAKVFSQNLIAKYFAKGIENKANGFVALNTALSTDGLFVHVPENLKVTLPVEVIHLNSSGSADRTMHHTRQMVILEKGAELKLYEKFVNLNEKDNTFTNLVNEFVVSENANFEYYKIQNENNISVQVNQTEIAQDANSVFFSTILTLGGALVRNDLNSRLNASNTEAHFNGLYIGENKSVIDNHTIVDHKFPHTYSNELYKGIMTDKSQAIFNGRIFVREDAQKTNAYQTNRNIILTDEASVNTKPQLEIWADDVRCSHGATTGQLDENAIFYLRSRGLSKEAAKKFLLKAFTAEVIDTIKEPQIADHFEMVLQDKLKLN